MCFFKVNAQEATTGPSLPKREFRGVWVATVENIDWPNKAGETTDKQQQELLNLLDQCKKEGINAVIFQVRPAADAFYAKSLEPWSKYLTGRQGKAPSPFFDPLAFAITEAHKRGMELHAWFNPYRATKDTNYKALSPDHITNKKPDWFFTYGGMKLFNPGIPAVRDYIVKVILHVVDNYDVDGIHMDDYFYPYKIEGQKINDEEAFKQYGNGFTNIEDWRRNNINLLVKMLNDSIHLHNPRIKFGISPSCIWANKYQDADGSDTHGGDTYFQLYADTRKWIKEGWIDYIVPQIYHSQTDKRVNFNVLVDWWGYHAYNRQLYIGQGPYRAVANKLADFKVPDEIPNEIKYLRKNTSVQGSVFFSANSLTKNPLGVTDSLINNYYRYPALPPVMLWLDSVAPNPPRKPTAKNVDNKIIIKWKAPRPAKDKEPIYGYIIYRFMKNGVIDLDDPKYIRQIVYNQNTCYQDSGIRKGEKYFYIITAIDRLKNESTGSRKAAVTVH